MKDVCLTGLTIALWAVAAFAHDGVVECMSLLLAFIVTLQLIERLTT